MKLNLGCSRKGYHLQGYKNIDIDPSCEADETYDISKGIKEEDDSVSEILISHVFQYIEPSLIQQILKDCYRVLMPGRVINISETNRKTRAQQEVFKKRYGNKEFFTWVEMEDKLQRAGFVKVRLIEPFEHKQLQYHLNLPNNYPYMKGRNTVYYIQGEKKIKQAKPTVYLGLDDFGEKNSNMDLLWRLRDNFDDFRVNLFATIDNNLRDSWLNYIHDLKWIQLCVHGYHHVHHEELDEDVLKVITPKPFVKVYKAPFWELSDGMYERLKKLGFEILLHQDDPREGIKYNWEIDRNIPNSPIIHAYGHVYPHDYRSAKGNTGSSLFSNYKNIMKLHKDTNFEFYERRNQSA